MDTRQQELRLARLALDLDFVTTDELQQALADWEKHQLAVSMSEILVRKGYVTERQLARLLQEDRSRVEKEGNYVEVRKGDVLFGEILTGNGWVTEEQVKRALASQQRLAQKGTVRRLGEVLVDLGFISRDIVRAALKIQGRKPVTCPSCGADLIGPETQ